MKQTTFLILTIIILILIVIFTLQNTSEVSITLFFWKIKTSLALLIFSLFSIGVIIAIFVLTPIIISLRSTLKEDGKTISELREINEVSSDKKIENS